ncbi:hypothetical protein AYK26_07500 [Euryarchaeota archaeon SM23-78]|nr:MAG: hypothetical protein AYK26_07500 [Euryarchaeota archaeon SM23-78]
MPKKKKEEKRPEPFDKDAQLFSDLYSMVEDAEGNSSTWRDTTDTYYRLRMRYKKTKTFPFPGCSNLRLPTIETYVRKAKSALVGIYANIKPRMMVVPQSDGNLEKARRIEKFLDWLCDVKINLLGKLVVIVDKMLERGFCLAKVIWRMEDRPHVETLSLDDLSMEEATWLFDINTTDEMIAQAIIKKLDVDLSETVAEDNLLEVEKAVSEIRAGKSEIKLHLKDELYNAPDVMVVDPIYSGVPTDSGRDPQTVRMIYHEYYEPYDDLKKKADEGILDKQAVDNIDFIKNSDLRDFKLLINTKDALEGIERLENPSKLVRLIDMYAYYDLNKEGVRKCHFLLAPDFKQVLKKQTLENDSQKFPFIRFDAEVIDDRWYSSRGYPQHLEDISKEIDAQHNQKIDNQTIRNAPMFVFRSGIINPRLVKFIPGQGIPVPGMTALDDAFKVVNNNNPNVEFSYEREELLLKSVIQEYLGQMDYSVQSIINKRQPRTLGEVQMQAQAANTVFSLDAALFTNALSELFMQLLELCQQYMPERIVTLVTGENGVEPLHLSRDEIQGRYHIICRGNDINTNPYLRAQKALAKVQILLTPPFLQTGIVNPLNVYNIAKRYLQDDGELGWKEMISKPQPQPPMPDIQPKFEDLTDKEQAQILAKMGIQPDVQGRALKSRSIVQEKESEQQAQQVENLSKIADMAKSTPGE